MMPYLAFAIGLLASLGAHAASWSCKFERNCINDQGCHAVDIEQGIAIEKGVAKLEGSREDLSLELHEPSDGVSQARSFILKSLNGWASALTIFADGQAIFSINTQIGGQILGFQSIGACVSE